MGRGRQCQTFLDHTDEEWMFVSDTDMTWDPTLPAQMVQLAERGATLDDGTIEPIRILAAPAWIVWTAQDGTVERRVPNVYQGFQDDQGQHWLSQMTEEALAAPGLYKVGACGGHSCFCTVTRSSTFGTIFVVGNHSGGITCRRHQSPRTGLVTSTARIRRFVCGPVKPVNPSGFIPVSGSDTRKRLSSTDGRGFGQKELEGNG